MFQPAEEIFEGSKDMVENGLLKNPKPDVALATHVVVVESQLELICITAKIQ